MSGVIVCITLGAAVVMTGTSFSATFGITEYWLYPFYFLGGMAAYDIGRAVQIARK